LTLTLRGLKAINYKEIISQNILNVRYKELEVDKILKEVEIYTHIIQPADFGTDAKELSVYALIGIVALALCFIGAVAWVFKTLLGKCRH